MVKNCTLCPRMCGVNREKNETGFCLCGDTVRVARAAPHFWEEPCISGTKGSGTVFFSGCSLGCIYCQNNAVGRGCSGYDISVERLADIFLELQDKGVHNINLVTPTSWVPHISAALDISWKKGLWIPAVYNCGGYENTETLRSLAGYIRIYLPDFKYADPVLAGELSSASDYPETAKKALYEMVNQTGSPVLDRDGIMMRGVIVRHLVLPGQLENSVNVLDYLHSEYGDSIYISIMSQYTPMPGMTGELSRTLSEAEYRTVTDYARSIGISNAYVQEGSAASESFIPAWDGSGVIKP